ncbi:mpg1 [Acrasis kona]|uniref:Mpg1 n=1 Tax=Acrasis kona TaxID=1008807 RepID=A0AAW2YH25_9EUKA
MKVILLAAGYGTRLQKDIQGKEEFSHLINVPKPLLPLNGVPLASRWLNLVKKVPAIKFPEDVIIVTNDYYLDSFLVWAEQYNFPIENIVNDGSTTNDNRLGAIADIKFAADRFENNHDTMIIGGDTLFPIDFNLELEVSKFLGKQAKSPTILFYSLDEGIDTSEKGIVDIEMIPNTGDYRVTRFIEKPKPHETNSRIASPCFYLLDSYSVTYIDKFLDFNKTDKYSRDAPGHFVKYLCENLKEVNAREVGKRFDVGRLSDYVEANEYFTQTDAK